MDINPARLLLRLKELGIEDVSSCNSEGEVWTIDGTRIQDRPDVAAIIAAHDPTEIAEPTVEEKLAALKLVVEMLMDEA